VIFAIRGKVNPGNLAQFFGDRGSVKPTPLTQKTHTGFQLMQFQLDISSRGLVRFKSSVLCYLRLSSSGITLLAIALLHQKPSNPFVEISATGALRPRPKNNTLRWAMLNSYGFGRIENW